MALGFEKLTDNEFAQVYLQFSQDFNDYENRGDERYQILYNRLYWSMYQNPNSKLSALPEADKYRLFHCLNVFWAAKDQPTDNINTNYQQIQLDYTEYRGCNHCHNDNFVLNWLLLSSLYNNSYSRYDGHNHHHHGRHVNGNSWEKNVQALLVLLFLAIASLAFIYLVSKMLDSLERIWFNEGINRGFMVLSMTIAAAVLTGYIASLLLLPVLTPSLALGLAVVGCGLMAGAVTAFLTDKVAAAVGKDSNAIDASEPDRFALSRDQMIDLTSKGFDIYSIDCAIMALRHKIGENGVPTYLKRVFWNRETHSAISQLHQLKLGKLDSLAVDGMVFKLKLENRDFSIYQRVDTYVPPEPARVQHWVHAGVGGGYAGFHPYFP